MYAKNTYIVLTFFSRFSNLCSSLGGIFTVTFDGATLGVKGATCVVVSATDDRSCCCS